MKKILVISTSLRNNSNTDALANAFIEGAKSKAHNVEKIMLQNKKINFCTGCDVCQNTQKCVIQDDVTEIVEKIHDADVVVFAAPVYYGGVSGQVQTLLDRTYPLFPWKLGVEQTHKFRDVYLLTAQQSKEENRKEHSDFVIKKIEQWIKHFNGSWITCPKDAKNIKLTGTVCGFSVHKPGEIKTHPEKIQEAYELGKSII